MFGCCPVLWALQLRREIWARDFEVIGIWFDEIKGVKKIAQERVCCRRMEVLLGHNPKMEHKVLTKEWPEGRGNLPSV